MGSGATPGFKFHFHMDNCLCPGPQVLISNGGLALCSPAGQKTCKGLTRGGPVGTKPMSSLSALPVALPLARPGGSWPHAAPPPPTLCSPPDPVCPLPHPGQSEEEQGMWARQGCDPPVPLSPPPTTCTHTHDSHTTQAPLAPGTQEARTHPRGLHGDLAVVKQAASKVLTE